jgi:hypothetical protein
VTLALHPPLPLPGPRALRTEDLLVLHAFDRALRLQLGALCTALASADASSVAQMDELRRFADATEAVVRDHHLGLDRLMGAIALATADAGHLIARLRSGHRAVIRALEHVGVRLQGMVGLATLGAIHELAEAQLLAVGSVGAAIVAVERQARLEGEELHPALLAALPADRLEELVAARWIGADAEDQAFRLPWLARAIDPSEELLLLAALPRMARLVHRFVWVPAHERSFPAIATAWQAVPAVG